MDGPGLLLKRLCSHAVLAVLAAALLLFACGEDEAAGGLLLGCVFSLANFFLLAKAIALTLGRSRNQARAIGFLSLLIRYGVLAIPLVIGITFHGFDFVGVVIGVFSIQITILVKSVFVGPSWIEGGGRSP